VSIVELVSGRHVVPDVPRHRDAQAALPSLPDVVPGQLWLIELDGACPMPVAAHQVLDHANVVIYDRILGDTIAQGLPLGGYAEPAPGAEAAAARSVRFARDGWSVARLLPAGLSPRERTRRVQDIVDELAGSGAAGRLPVAILAAAADGIEERLDVRFDNLAAVVASYPRDTRLTIVIDASAAGGAAVRLRAVAANGLAG
jgi:hypothetical protein